MPFVILVIAFVAAGKSSAHQSLALPGCPDTCGNLTNIPYPFGIGSGCFFDPRYEIDCQRTHGISTPVLKNLSLMVLDISLPGDISYSPLIKPGLIKVSQPILYSRPNCTTNQQKDTPVNSVDSNGTFLYSQSQNLFVAGGCNNLALMADDNHPSEGTIVGCKSSCKSESSKRFNGTDYCFTSIPNGIARYKVVFNTLDGKTMATGDAECSFAFLAEKTWWDDIYYSLAFNILPPAVPVALEWGVAIDELPLRRTGSPHNYYSNSWTSYTTCLCYEGYRGNCFLPQGCQDIDECEDQTICQGNCVNQPGSYMCIDNDNDNDNDNININFNNIAPKVVATAFGAIGVLSFFQKLYEYIQRSSVAKLKQIFFERNGGLQWQQRLSSIENSHMEKGKLFTLMELDTATDHFNENRILGRGGQGIVYKGMLIDGTIIAVKKSKIIDAGQVEQFVNEIIILSQINHRNVVKLLGLCLESEVPLLVYEFVPNGTLYQYLHDLEGEFIVSWETRLRIANEVAGALSYLHSAAAIPIYHRDIKSSNILLDEKYRAKVADFGASRSITIEQTHLTTMVRGTFGYLDPEYYRTSQFTDKSDVYSFGVVLVELLTGEKPISQLRAEEGRNLASYFVISMEENRLFDVLDKEVLDHGEKEEIIAVSSLAERCLSPNGRDRPTMKEVVTELELVRSLRNAPVVQQIEGEIDRIRTGSVHASRVIPAWMRPEAEVELTIIEEDQSLLSPR
ncbi:hypothetical protein BT93_A1822 [Corymbia citriodora subsp. variegata]|nr:hypothetical protein BT93_A1822 [Corymbia citriodora subsp. variegata]